MNDDYTPAQRDGLIEYLSGFLKPERRQVLEKVLSERTRHVSVVLEDIYQPHNASAVLRSCDCFGVQRVFTIEDDIPLDISRGVTRNAHRWLSLKRFREQGADNLTGCINHLKNMGYSIVATSPRADSIPITELPVNKPLALLFGREKTGLTQRAIDSADFVVHIPMHGFSESLNLSVSAAICLYEVVSKIKRGAPEDVWQIEPDERQQILLDWVRKSVKASRMLEGRFREISGLQDGTV